MIYHRVEDALQDGFKYQCLSAVPTNKLPGGRRACARIYKSLDWAMRHAVSKAHEIGTIPWFAVDWQDAHYHAEPL